MLPGDGYARESGGIPVLLHPPDKSALGKGWGEFEGGRITGTPFPRKGWALSRRRRGSPSPLKKQTETIHNQYKRKQR